MPACSCPSIFCGICGLLPLLGGVGWYFLNPFSAGGEEGQKWLLLTISEGDDFNIDRLVLASEAVDGFEEGDRGALNINELWMNAGAEISCDDVFAGLTVRASCSLDLVGCEEESMQTLKKDCETELSRPEAARSGPSEKMMKVASFEGKWFDVDLNGVATRTTSDFTIFRDSNPTSFIYSGWNGNLFLYQHTVAFINNLVLFLNLGQSACCCLCAGAIYGLTASAPPPGTGAHNVQMQQPMHQQQMQQQVA